MSMFYYGRHELSMAISESWCRGTKLDILQMSLGSLRFAASRREHHYIRGKEQLESLPNRV